MKYKYYNQDITELKPNQIFCFGSNLAGKHGAVAKAIVKDAVNDLLTKSNDIIDAVELARS